MAASPSSRQKENLRRGANEASVRACIGRGEKAITADDDLMDTRHSAVERDRVTGDAVTEATGPTDLFVAGGFSLRLECLIMTMRRRMNGPEIYMTIIFHLLDVSCSSMNYGQMGK